MKPKDYNRADHLSHHDKQITRFDNIHGLLNEARSANCWIFNKSSLTWWTPDEFYDEFHEKEFSNFAFDLFLEELSVRDPRAGITAAMKQLDVLFEDHHNKTKLLREKIEIFNKKVITFYQEQLKPRL